MAQPIEERVLKLVEEYSGVGGMQCHGQRFARVPYRISRFQGMAPNGLPIPGLQRLEGTIELAEVPEAEGFVGSSLTLELEDGRKLALTLADSSGRVLAEGHGPRHGCSCC